MGNAALVVIAALAALGSFFWLVGLVVCSGRKTGEAVNRFCKFDMFVWAALGSMWRNGGEGRKDDLAGSLVVAAPCANDHTLKQ